MSVILQISEQLKTLLASSLEGGKKVQLQEPLAVKNTENADVSLWLYQVRTDEFTRNNPRPLLPPGVNDGNRTRARNVSSAPPLGLTLCYLVTPLRGTADTDFDLLERMLLTIHESPLMHVQVPDQSIDEHVSLILPNESLEERLRIWESLKNEPYRLSFVCQVRIARLFATTTVLEAPVLSLSAVGSSEPDRN